MNTRNPKYGNVQPVVYAALMVLSCLMLSCNRTYVPKPIGYNRLDLPEPAYHPTPDTLPYWFEYSQHAKILKDTSFINARDWSEVDSPLMRATVTRTYQPVNQTLALLNEYVDGCYRLTAKPQTSAYCIDEVLVSAPSGKTAVIEDIEGEVPGQFQFTVTD